MSLPNIFTAAVSNSVISRINQLTPDAKPTWGKMDVARMLAHCNVTYELVYEKIHPKPNFILKFILKAFIKKTVTTEKPYKHNSPTSPAFIIKDKRDFYKEKGRLINYIYKTRELGEAHFQGKMSHSFGPLSTEEWNNMFYKHLDHHLTQFGV